MTEGFCANIRRLQSFFLISACLCAPVVCPGNDSGAPLQLEAELMRTQTGYPFGIRAEIINPDKQRYLILFAPEGIASLFHVVLFDETGFAVSPLPAPPEQGKAAPSDKHVVIAPFSRHFFRVPLPGELREDPSGLTNSRLVPIRKGKYRIQLRLRGICFMSERVVFSVDDKPDYLPFRLVKDLGRAEITPEYAGE